MVTEVVTQNKQFTLNNSTQIIPLAFSSVRETDTIVRAHDGQVIVIGGLMSDRSERNNAGLPGLSSVPGVGELFKHRNDKSRKTRSEEHTSELQSLMRISYAVFCLKKKTKNK